MESIKKLESTIEGWLKPLPHLPANIKKWIANNIWWLDLVGVILIILTGIPLISAILLSLGATAFFWSANIVALTGFAIFATFSSLAFLAVSLVIMILAVKPLKALKKKGWDYLFIGLLVSCVSVIFTALSSFSSLFGGAIGVAISAYFLFEIRSYFVAVK